jgi:hypothetical protein
MIGFPSMPNHVRSGGGIPTARHGRRTEPRLRTEIVSPNEMMLAATAVKKVLFKCTIQKCKGREQFPDTTRK